MKDENATVQPAPVGQVERPVGRLAPERNDADDGDYDDTSEPDDGAWCDHCNGDGMDPDCDYLLPCPACQGEQRP